ncbi:hypothetical protein ABZS66_59845 [Dactylosporangium sp. NPDC005572]|uniref:hypothetical protein n=1 Tax=Dactylosporangium sp. NPDC005572 TaxID=3156889 RepID=UPI0033BD39AC
MTADAAPTWEHAFKRMFGVHEMYPGPDRLTPGIAAAVPGFVERARSAASGRATALSAAGRAADPERSRRPSAEARAALRRLAGDLAPFLDGPDAAVRAAAAYALTQADAGPDVLRRRLAVETEPVVRAALLLGLGEAATGASPVDADPTVVVAGALAAARSGVPWTAGTVEAVAAALAAGVRVPEDWLRRESPLADLLCAAGPAAGMALLDALLRALPAEGVTGGPMVGAVVVGESVMSSAKPVDETAGAPRGLPSVLPVIWALRPWTPFAPLAAAVVLLRGVEDACRWHRPARTGLATWAGRWLRHGDPAVRVAAVAAVAATGPAAAPWADDLARLSADEETPKVARQTAAWVLLQLGDARGVGLERWGPARTVAELDAVGDRLDQAVAAGDAATVAVLAERLRAAGAGQVSRLRAVRALAPRAVALALARANAAEPVDLPELRVLAAEGVEPKPAFAVWRLTGDRDVVLATLRRAHDTSDWQAMTLGLTMAAEAGLEVPNLPAELLESPWPNGASLMVRRTQLAAARLLPADGPGPHPPAEVRATIREIMVDGGAGGGEAALLAAELGWDWLTDAIRDLAHGEHDWSAPAAAEALWRLGAAKAEELTPALVTVVEHGVRPAEAVRALVAIGARAAAPHLTRLAERDRAVAYDYRPHRMVWDDERLRAELRAAAAGVTPAG